MHSAESDCGSRRSPARASYTAADWVRDVLPVGFPGGRSGPTPSMVPTGRGVWSLLTGRASTRGPGHLPHSADRRGRRGRPGRCRPRQHLHLAHVMVRPFSDTGGVRISLFDGTVEAPGPGGERPEAPSWPDPSLAPPGGRRAGRPRRRARAERYRAEAGRAGRVPTRPTRLGPLANDMGPFPKDIALTQVVADGMAETQTDPPPGRA